MQSESTQRMSLCVKTSKTSSSNKPLQNSVRSSFVARKNTNIQVKCKLRRKIQS